MKAFGMSDAEDGYRTSIAQAWGGEPLMCYFHVVQAIKTYVESHAKFSNLSLRRLFWKKIVEPAILQLHHSKSRLDFTSRWEAIRERWLSSGVAAATAWVDKNGVEHTLVSYIEKTTI